jgi:hypothetical protein
MANNVPDMYPSWFEDTQSETPCVYAYLSYLEKRNTLDFGQECLCSGRPKAQR